MRVVFTAFSPVAQMHRCRTGKLPADVVSVLSDRQDIRRFAEWCGLPYHFRSLTPETRAHQEEAFDDIAERIPAFQVT